MLCNLQKKKPFCLTNYLVVANINYSKYLHFVRCDVIVDWGFVFCISVTCKFRGSLPLSGQSCSLFCHPKTVARYRVKHPGLLIPHKKKKNY